MDKDVKVEPVCHDGLNLYNHNGKLIATALRLIGLFILDQAMELTEYTNIDNHSCLLALRTTGHPSRHDA